MKRDALPPNNSGKTGSLPERILDPDPLNICTDPDPSQQICPCLDSDPYTSIRIQHYWHIVASLNVVSPGGGRGGWGMGGRGMGEGGGGG